MKKSRHHRKPLSQGGKSEPPNTVQVPHEKHTAWHILFKNMTAQEIIQEINSYWLDPDYKLVMVRAGTDPSY